MIIYNPSVGKEIGNSKIEATEFSYVSGNSLIKRYVDPPKVVVLGYRGYRVNDIIYSKELADCVEKLESNFNPLAYNRKDTDGRPKYSLYQFGQQEWENLCGESMEDVYNLQKQRDCFQKLVLLGQSWRWPSVKKCISILSYSKPLQRKT